MESGGLVSDEIVIGIVADRIEEPDAQKGFILDGFPRTVAQAEALDGCWREKGLKLDAVIELQVDESTLLSTASRSAPRETVAAGGTVRTDDNPEVFKTRLAPINQQTAPVVGLLQVARRADDRRRHGADRRGDRATRRGAGEMISHAG